MDVDFDETVGLGLRRYVRLATEALGMAGECSYVEMERPLAAYLALEGRVPRFPDRDVALLWNEDCGWSPAVETDSCQDPLVLAYKGGELVPPPRTVAEWASTFLRGEQAVEPTPAFRMGTASDDPGRRLSSYATVELLSAQRA